MPKHLQVTKAGRFAVLVKCACDNGWLNKIVECAGDLIAMVCFGSTD